MIFALAVSQPTFVIDPAWVSVGISAALLLLTCISVLCAFLAYRHQKNRSKKAEACNLAQYYANSIIEKYGLIITVFNSTGLTELVKTKLDLKELKDFDKNELTRLLEKKNMTLDSFKAKMENISPEAIFEAMVNCASSEADRDQKIRSYLDQGKDGKNQIINGFFLQRDFRHEIGFLLNELEWFSMSCRYGLADEKLLYQSLQQSYLSTVWILYYYISIQNIKNEDKYYTNVIWLFTVWYERLNKIVGKAEKEQAKLRKKIERKKPKVFSGKPV